MRFERHNDIRLSTLANCLRDASARAARILVAVAGQEIEFDLSNVDRTGDYE